jgi:3-deoxy-D-manno-octulosonic-acid transferase
MALPIVTGPHNFNAEDIAEMLEDVGAVRVARDSTELFDELATSLSDPALSRQRGLAGRRVLDENRGALDRLMTLVIPLMTSVRDSTAQQSAAG